QRPLLRKLAGRPSAKRTVFPSFVVLLFPRGHDPSRLFEVEEPVLIEALVPEPAIEAFYKAVLHRFSRLNELELDAVLVRPLVESMADELRPIVANDRVRVLPSDRRRLVE